MLVDKLKNRSSPGLEVKREQRPAVLCMAQEGKVRVPHPLQSFGLLGLMSELFVNNEERGSEGHLPSNGWKALESCCNCSLGFNFPRAWVIGPPGSHIIPGISLPGVLQRNLTRTAVLGEAAFFSRST